MTSLSIEEILISKETMISKAGYEFKISDKYWVLDKDITMPIGSLYGYLDKASEDGCIKVLAVYAKSYS